MKTGRIFDLSVTLSDGMPVWPDEESIRIVARGEVADEGYALEDYFSTTHSGTHIDAPCHMVKGGKSIDRIPLETFTGAGYCIRPIPKGTEIDRDSLERVWSQEYDGNIVLINAGWDRKRSFSREFQYEFPGLSSDSVEFLLEHRVKMVGIDSLGIEPYGHSDFAVHKGLLSHGVPLIEDMAGLHQLEVGKCYFIVALPLKIGNGSGSMARVIAMETVGE